ncbi:MAG: TlpA disulfide reductase family protein [Tessaracoccus sp.]
MPRHADSKRSSLITVAGVAVVTVLILALVIVVKGMPEIGEAAADEPAGPRVGMAAPDFRALDIAGEPVRLEDYRGAPVWLFIQATWCSSCRAELPDVEASLDRVEVISIYMREDRDIVNDYVQRLGLQMRSVPDPIGEISLAYLTTSVPTHFFIDAEGDIAAVAKGILSPAEIDEHLTAIGA